MSLIVAVVSLVPQLKAIAMLRRWPPPFLLVKAA